SRGRIPTARLLKVPAHWLVDRLHCDAPLFNQSALHRVVTILAAGGFFLHHHARTCFDDGHGRDCAIRRKQLRHANFLADDSVNHCLPKALISTSTPAGKSSFISASTVCGVGSRMSIRRLCVLISNCSRDFLSTCGERRTVHLFFTVGNGIGPATRAPVRFAVSTISVVD